MKVKEFISDITVIRDVATDMFIHPSWAYKVDKDGKPIHYSYTELLDICYGDFEVERYETRGTRFTIWIKLTAPEDQVITRKELIGILEKFFGTHKEAVKKFRQTTPIKRKYTTYKEVMDILKKAYQDAPVGIDNWHSDYVINYLDAEYRRYMMRRAHERHGI